MAPASRTKPAKKSPGSSSKLAQYQSMRDFSVTREPRGEQAESGKAREALSFVIQKHAATRLHYDFRLEWEGVLKSWAVTKGPSYFPGDKRLAVQVEDHPLEYGGFEGIIPKGQYGGGTVMLWDRGTWEPAGDAAEGLQKGSLKFVLHGEKLKGHWALIRMGGKAAREDKPNWLLIKEHDAEEKSADSEPITESAPDSVLSGRDMDAIAKDRDKVWQSNRAETGSGASQLAESPVARTPETPKPQQTPAPGSRKKATRTKLDLAAKLKDAPRAKMPGFRPPQLASLGSKPPSGARWVHELKLDGYRIQIHIDRAQSPSVTLLTRNGLDWTDRLRPIAEAALQLPVSDAVIDGELVVLNADGNTSFAALQAAFQANSQDRFTYFAFDLLHIEGHDIEKMPLLERKAILAEVLGDRVDTLRLSEHLEGDAEKIFRQACGLGCEGIVSKLADGAYVPGRSKSWIKCKCYQEQEFVLGGFTLPSNGTHGVGALMLGYYRDDELIYAGRTGTGFTQATHRMLRGKLDKLRRERTPFKNLPAGVSRGAHWVDPALVGQVSFSNWTADGIVRQASFKGLREDKTAKSVRRESPAAAEGTAKTTETKNDQPARKTPEAAPQPGRINFRLTHPDKVVDPDSAVTKQALALYYQAVSGVLFPHIADRPLSLVRCPDGTGHECFYQKHKNKMISGSFGMVEVVDRKSGKPEPYITISKPDTIAELAQVGALEVHPWGSCNAHLENPDRLVFDLDPDEAIPWNTLAASAREIRRRLSQLKLKSFVKSTGGKGLHVVAPIMPDHTWAEIKEFAHSFVLALEKEHSDLYLTKMTKSARKGKIYLDYLRNERGSTAVAPYSPRARVGLPVAVPLAWSEVGEERPPVFSVATFAQWKSRLKHDPWKELPKLNQHLSI